MAFSRIRRARRRFTADHPAESLRGQLLILISQIDPRAGMTADALIRGTGIGGLVLSFMFLLAYFSSKRLGIEIESGGGRLFGIRIKPSLVGPVIINLEQILDAVEIINSVTPKYFGAERSSKE
jgi:hypothetical protein